MFGILLMLMSLILIKHNKAFAESFCIAVFSFVVAIWTLCNRDLITIVFMDLSIKMELEYVTFFTIAIPCTYYFKNRVMADGTPAYLRIMFWVLITAELLIAGGAMILNRFNIIHYSSFVPIYHVAIIAVAVFILMLSISEHKRRLTNKGTIAIGFGLALAVVLFELIRFNLSKYITGFANNEYSSTLCYAVLIVVCTLLWDFGQYVSANLYKDAQQKLFMKMAYTDELTGLSNRRKCDEVLKELKKNNESYSVISIDMNFLKKVNDSLGHDVGDAMIKRFSETLNEVFATNATVGRMGGDEFIVILPGADRSEAENRLAELDRTIEKKNNELPDIKLSCAYGAAGSTELGAQKDPHEIYRLADDRMYENKRLSKLGRAD